MIGLGMFAAVGRWSLALQEAKAKQEAHGDLVNMISGMIGDFLTSRGTMYATNDQGNENLH